MYKVLKAKYFPTTNFLESKIGSNPSYSWRSICGCKDLIYRTPWSVGNGQDIKIWKDRWSAAAEISDQSLVLTMWMKMQRLVIYLTNKQCNGTRNCWTCFWHFTKDGNYTVRSGYHLLAGLESNETGLERDNVLNRPLNWEYIWSSIWKATIPNKVKMFSWRFCQEILPIYANLVKRRIPVESLSKM